MQQNAVHLVGFGGQGRAWAQCLRASGWDVQIYLPRPTSPSFEAARELGFHPQPLETLTHRLEKPPASGSSSHFVAMLCPDSVIGALYCDTMASLSTPITVILAHGYAVYAGDLKAAQPSHEIALIAPKAIGPKIWTLFQEAHEVRGGTHRLVAGFHASSARDTELRALALGLGFASTNLVPATFEQEAIGDLLSEQGLLCGGLFTLMEWTMEAMQKAGVPNGLIHEECLTELELIAGLLRERGPASTFSIISQAAQCGTVAMQARLEASDARKHFTAQLQDVLTGKFAEEFRAGNWKPRAKALTERLARWEKELRPGDPI